MRDPEVRKYAVPLDTRLNDMVNVRWADWSGRMHTWGWEVACARFTRIAGLSGPVVAIPHHLRWPDCQVVFDQAGAARVCSRCPSGEERCSHQGVPSPLDGAGGGVGRRPPVTGGPEVDGSRCMHASSMLLIPGFYPSHHPLLTRLRLPHMVIGLLQAMW